VDKKERGGMDGVVWFVLGILCLAALRWLLRRVDDHILRWLGL
jgi:hypothetical protein